MKIIIIIKKSTFKRLIKLHEWTLSRNKILPQNGGYARIILITVICTSSNTEFTKFLYKPAIFISLTLNFGPYKERRRREQAISIVMELTDTIK